MGARSSKITAQNNRSDGHLLEYFRNTFVRGGGGTNIFHQFYLEQLVERYLLEQNLVT
jgi:hypothetical protein